MAHPEQIKYFHESILEQTDLSQMAKPAIPVLPPQRRAIPEIPDPMPERLVPPAPSKPVKKPQEPIPAR